MEIREFAERVLYSARLEDKLLAPVELTDLHPGPPLPTPLRPARAPELSFGREKVPFPHAERLVDPVARGQLLHFFANHELLALELMALVLLRFPDAPPRFRRGLVGTMRDEQRHLQAYLDRMRSLGVELGSLGLSDFFWSALRDVKSPLHFVAGMSLTLEQANLDFMIDYRRAFLGAEDEETAAILGRVLEDEIRHVRHGHRWFERWRPHAQTAFEEYRALVVHPLTPARAKGRQLDRGSRQRAGLSEEFIDATLAFRASKGRPPLVHVPNFDAEDRLAGRAGRVPEGLIADLAPLLMFVARPDDAVLLPRAPRTAFLAKLARAGFELAEPIVGTSEADAHRALANRPPAGFAPWANTTRTPAALFDKSWAARFAGRPSERFVARSPADAEAAVRELLGSGHAEVVLKAGLSAAGRHRTWVRSPPAVGDLAGFFAAENVVVVIEPWRERLLDLGVLIDTRREAPVIETLRFFTDGRGQYKGHLLGPRFSGVSKALRDFLFRPSDDHPDGAFHALEERALEVARALEAEGYQGPASIDAMVYRAEGRLVLEPVVEVNPRHTMGFIARALSKHLAPRHSALWLHLSKRDAKRLGYADLGAWARAVEAKAPLLVSLGHSAPLLESGVLFTTDPESSQHVLTVLAVGEELEDVDRILGQPSMLRSIQAVFS